MKSPKVNKHMHNYLMKLPCVILDYCEFSTNVWPGYNYSRDASAKLDLQFNNVDEANQRLSG